MVPASDPPPLVQPFRLAANPYPRTFPPQQRLETPLYHPPAPIVTARMMLF